MININRSSLLPSIHSFHYSIPLTSTPKRSNKSYCSQPLSSTLTVSNDSCKKMDLSISAITFIKKSSLHQKKRRRYYHRRRTHIHSSKRIELKYLLYSTRVTKPKQTKQCYNEMKIYIV
jgi:hypothetical protein